MDELKPLALRQAKLFDKYVKLTNGFHTKNILRHV